MIFGIFSPLEGPMDHWAPPLPGSRPDWRPLKTDSKEEARTSNLLHWITCHCFTKGLVWQEFLFTWVRSLESPTNKNREA